jgi:hypothetical protein
VDDATEVMCDRCGRVLSHDVSLWVELSPGNLRIGVLREIDESLAFTRAWHVSCSMRDRPVA